MTSSIWVNGERLPEDQATLEGDVADLAVLRRRGVVAFGQGVRGHRGVHSAHGFTSYQRRSKRFLRTTAKAFINTRNPRRTMMAAEVGHSQAYRRVAAAITEGDPTAAEDAARQLLEPATRALIAALNALEDLGQQEEK